MRLGKKLRKGADANGAASAKKLRKVEDAGLEEMSGGRDPEGQHKPPRFRDALDKAAAHTQGNL